MVGLNAIGLVPWLQARAHAQQRDRAFLDTLAGLGVRTGYAGFWIGPKYTFLSDGEVILSGELGPDVSWVHQGQARLVRRVGPDALVVDPDLAAALEARLTALGCSFQRTDSIGQAVYHDLSRRVSLEELAGFDVAAPRRRARSRIRRVEPKITQDESVTEVETIDSTVVVADAPRQCDASAKRQSLYTIEYL